MIVIDPERGGCVLWKDLNVTHIRGNIEDCADAIFRRIMIPIEDDENVIIGYYQIEEVGLDVAGIGRAWKDEFTKIGIKTDDIIGKQIDNFLPQIKRRISKEVYDMYESASNFKIGLKTQ
ncbi:MAG: hypothetical protein K0R54_2761 [Clostridiaceae bacterium]|nr:hypothetical protein [Clostridiaceae bacterium]MDF2950479.1 hypothetical protein [Anaerocolumna sp.]